VLLCDQDLAPGEDADIVITELVSSHPKLSDFPNWS